MRDDALKIQAGFKTGLFRPSHSPRIRRVLAGSALLLLMGHAEPLFAADGTGTAAGRNLAPVSLAAATARPVPGGDGAKVAELWDKGREAQLAGQWDVAIENFSSLLELQPQHLDAIVALGFSYFKKGDLDESEKLYRRALSLDNRHVGAGFGWGQVEMARKNWQNAAALFRDILRIAPNFQPVAARHNLALSLFSLKRYQEAEEVYEEIFAQPESLFTPELFVNALDNEIALERYGRAAYWGNEGTRLFPDAAALWDRLAWALRRVDEIGLSDQAYSRAEALVYTDTKPHHQTVLSLPFRGPWRVIQGNNGRSTHRGLGSRFAWDFQALAPSAEASLPPDSLLQPDPSVRNGTTLSEQPVVGNGQGESKVQRATADDWQLGGWHDRSFEDRRGRWRHDNTDFASFGQDVLAPAPGRVIALQDGTPDNDPFHRNPSPYSGNYILIEHAPGEYSSLGHLQNGSIKVKVGDIVERGQVIARCGNSGNTSLPHLHYSFIGLYKGTRVSMPAQFSNYLLRTAVPQSESAPPVASPDRVTSSSDRVAVAAIELTEPVKVVAGIPTDGMIVENAPPETKVVPEITVAPATPERKE